MPPDPNLYLPETYVAREVRKALRCERLVSGGSPTLALTSLFRVLPTRDAHGCLLVVALFGLRINVISARGQLTLFILSHHFDINLLSNGAHRHSCVTIHWHGW